MKELIDKVKTDLVMHQCHIERIDKATGQRSEMKYHRITRFCSLLKENTIDPFVMWNDMLKGTVFQTCFAHYRVISES